MAFQKYTITGSTGTINPSTGINNIIPNIEIYAATQITLSQGLAIAPTSPTAPTSFLVLWNASVLLGGFSVTICGITINQDLADSTGQFLCSYDGSSWTVQSYPDQINNSQVIKGTGTLNIINTGSVTLTVGEDQNYQRASNTVTLTGNSDVSLSTAGATENDWFWIRLDGGVTVGAFTLSVAGIAISEYDALNGGVSVYAFYDGTTWRAQQMGGSINAADIPDGTIAVTKFASIAAYSTYANSTASPAVPTVETAATANDVLTASGFAKLVAANFAPSLAPTSIVAVNISNAELLDGFTTGGTLAAAAGASTLQYPIAAMMRLEFGSAAFTTYLTMKIQHVGASNAILTQVGGLGSASDNIFYFVPVTGTIATSQLIENADIEWRVATGNPLVGTDTTATIFLIYTTISLGLA
jgi:hypothetical protein